MRNQWTLKKDVRLSHSFSWFFSLFSLLQVKSPQYKWLYFFSIALRCAGFQTFFSAQNIGPHSQSVQEEWANIGSLELHTFPHVGRTYHLLHYWGTVSHPIYLPLLWPPLAFLAPLPLLDWLPIHSHTLPGQQPGCKFRFDQVETFSQFLPAPSTKLPYLKYIFWMQINLPFPQYF
jgi:hypothetical protein